MFYYVSSYCSIVCFLMLYYIFFYFIVLNSSGPSQAVFSPMAEQVLLPELL